MATWKVNLPLTSSGTLDLLSLLPPLSGLWELLCELKEGLRCFTDSFSNVVTMITHLI